LLSQTQPAQLVRAPAGSTLHYRLTVPTTVGGVTLVSLLPNGVLPSITPPTTNPAGNVFAFKIVQLQSESDPNTAQVRYIVDGQSVPVIGTNLGFVVAGQPGLTTIPCDPQDIKLIASVSTFVQCYLVIQATTTGPN
jgi:hypothetical protein